MILRTSSETDKPRGAPYIVRGVTLRHVRIERRETLRFVLHTNLREATPRKELLKRRATLRKRFTYWKVATTRNNLNQSFITTNVNAAVALMNVTISQQMEPCPNRNIT